MTQDAMNGCAAQELANADAELDRAYLRLLARYKQDEVLLSKLRTAQRAWVAYRDAHPDSWYPEIDKRFYGSVRPMCQALLKTRLTQQRLDALREMLNPVEGDVCAFSLPDPGENVR